MPKVNGSLERKPGKRNDTWVARLRIEDVPKKEKLGNCWDGRGTRPRGTDKESWLTATEAQNKFNDLLADIRNGRVVYQTIKTGTSFEDACEAWLKWAQYDRGLKRSTVDSYRKLLPRLYDHFVADTPVEKITTKKIKDFRVKLMEEERATSTIMHYMVALNKVFERAMAESDIGLKTNPMEKVEWEAPTVNYDFNVFEADEIVRLADAALSDFDTALLLVAGFCGPRVGELRALTWKDVKMREDEKSLTLFYNFPINILTRPTAERELKRFTPKSGKPRVAPLPDQCIPALKKHRLSSPYSGDDDLVFPDPGGDLFDYGSMRRRFLRTTKRAGLDQRRVHDLRHSAATLFARIFPNAFKVQAIMGHADIATTMKYVHMTPQGEDADVLSKGLSERLDKQPGKRRAA